MVNSVKILVLLILLINICIQANVTEDSKALTNEFEFKNRNLDKTSNAFVALDFFKESQPTKMAGKLRKDVKKPNRKCIMFKMSVFILRVPVKPAK